MAKPRVMVLRAAGVNCDGETQYAWNLVGAEADLAHINALRERPEQLHDYQILTVPGGFSYGDDIAAGKILGNELKTFLGPALAEFVARDGLVLGICNGFQVLCNADLLPGRSSEPPLPQATITDNVSGKYEDRWVHLERCSQRCVFLQGKETYELPVAHAEGRVMTTSLAEMDALDAAGCVALRYRKPDGGPVEYPHNPNGSIADVAGLCDLTGRIFGLMPHPERFIHATQHPRWTAGGDDRPNGRAIFESAVNYFA